MDQLTEFSLRHISGGRPAKLTVDPTGKIVKVAGIPDLKWAISVAGFTADGLDAGPDLDLSARYALAHDPQLTVGLTPIIDTADGRTILLYTVVHAGPRTADRDALIGDQDLWDVSAYDPAGTGLISSRALVGVPDRMRIVDAISTRLGANIMSGDQPHETERP